MFPLTEKLNGARLVKSEALRVTLELVFVRSMLQPPLSSILWIAGSLGLGFIKLGISPLDSISERISS